MSYELVCGIETHVELATKTKIFCSCTTEFGGEPNTHCCPVCTGQPGALPSLNRSVVDYAVRAGLALNCDINNNSHMDRKNYFYPDLPKAYQISQFDEPLCVNGYVTLDSGKRIRIERIHIEEDAGKLIHEGEHTYIDYNRGGVPLIEIVSMADISTPDEAREYAEKLRLIMRYAGVSDCKMQEGSMRCDVNVSLHKPNEPWGTRTEIKNIGSLSNIVKAIECEMKRQSELLDRGCRVIQSTMRYDEKAERVCVLRTKENADDYRFFPEPDILRFHVSKERVEAIRNGLPELPDEKLKRYVEALNLPERNARLVCQYKSVADFFDEVVDSGADAQNSLNLIIGTVFAVLKTEEEKENFEIKIKSDKFSELVKLVDRKKIRINKAKEVLALMLESGSSAFEYINEEDMKTLSHKDLEAICKKAVEENPRAVADVKNGKSKAANVLIGYVMKNSRGKADVKEAESIIKNIINYV